MMEELFDEEFARKQYEISERRYYEEKGKAEGIAGIVVNMLRSGVFTKKNIALATGLSNRAFRGAD